MAEKKMTIKDIAKLADVSPGTVDRVLHNRGRVSSDKRERIDLVLQDINYQPNLIAKTLKNNKVYRLAALMPDGNDDPYWGRAEQGLRKGLEEFGSFGIAGDLVCFTLEDAGSMWQAYESIADNYDCLLLAPVFGSGTEAILADASERALPVVTFNTHPNSEHQCAFIGQDLEQSGRVAGNLIHLSRANTGPTLLLHIDEVPESAPHIANKEKGIRSYLTQEGGLESSQVHSLCLYHGDNPLIDQLAKSPLLSVDLSAVYISTSWAYEVASYIKQRAPQAIIVGYDLVEPNIDLLRKGVITYLIDQNPYQQAYLGISTFCDHLVFGKSIPQEQLLALNVVFKENLQSIVKGRPGLF